MRVKIVGTRKTDAGYTLVVKAKKTGLKDIQLPSQTYLGMVKSEKKLTGRKLFLRGDKLEFPVRGRLLSAEPVSGGLVAINVQRKGKTWVTEIPADLFKKAAAKVGGSPVGLKMKAFGDKVKFRLRGTVTALEGEGSTLSVAIRSKDGTVRVLPFGGERVALKASARGKKVRIATGKAKKVKAAEPK